MCRSLSSARHFEGLQCLHLQVLNMDLSFTLKVSYILNCLTLGDEGDKILQNTGNYSPNDADDLNPQHKICMTENSQYKSRPYKLCKELFSRYVPCTFLSTFKLQQNSCCLDRSTTYHTTQLLPAISKHVTIAKQTQFPISCSRSQRKMDGWQQTVVGEASAHHRTLQTQLLGSKEEDSTNVKSSSFFMQWQLVINFIRLQVNVLPFTF